MDFRNRNVLSLFGQGSFGTLGLGPFFEPIRLRIHHFPCTRQRTRYVRLRISERFERARIRDCCDSSCSSCHCVRPVLRTMRDQFLVSYMCIRIRRNFLEFHVHISRIRHCVTFTRYEREITQMPTISLVPTKSKLYVIGTLSWHGTWYMK